MRFTAYALDDIVFRCGTSRSQTSSSSGGGSLATEEQESIKDAVDLLEERGPALGRPLVDTVTASRHANMKEL